MRTAAFAEFQAVAAFTWAAENLADAPDDLRHDWLRQVSEEQKHYDMIVARMTELGLGVADRPVSRGLWDSLAACTTAREFCIKIVNAEERGRQAGLRLIQFLNGHDAATVAIFQTIVDDEVAHVALANTYYGWKPDTA